MDTQAISSEILEIRKQLRMVREKGETLPVNAVEARVDLQDEENELQARLAQLQENLAGHGVSRSGRRKEKRTLKLPTVVPPV